MLSRSYPEAIGYLNGCLREFLNTEGRPDVMLICGRCSLVGYTDSDGITNTVEGACDDETASDWSGMMTSNAEQAL